MGNLHAIVTFAGPSLVNTTLMHRVFYLSSSREDNIIHKWLSDLINIFKCTWHISCWSITVIPSLMSVSSSLPIFWEDHIINLFPLCPRRFHAFHLFFLSEESPYLRLVPPLQIRSISSTCSSFPKRVHIFDLFLLSKKGPYIHPSSLRVNIYINTTVLPCEESM